MDISALSLVFEKGENTYIARGEVEIIDGTRRLTADYVRYNKNTEDAYAEGNVVFREGPDVIYCSSMTLNMITRMGTIEKGRIFIKQGNFTIVGSEIEKLGDNEYEIRKGQFTSCDMTGPERACMEVHRRKRGNNDGRVCKDERHDVLYSAITPCFTSPRDFSRRSRTGSPGSLCLIS